MKFKILLHQSFDVEGLKSFEIRDKFVTFTFLNGEHFEIPLAAFAGIVSEKPYWTFSDKLKDFWADFGSDK